MLLNLVRTDKGLAPIDDESVKAIQKVKVGSNIYCEFKPRRNMKFHKKYWALLNAVLINQEHFKTVDNIHEAVKYRAGYYETIFTFNGESFIKTKSISFHTLDNMEFESFYNTAIDVCVELVGDNAVEQIIKFN
jgi:hypothetical protein